MIRPTKRRGLTAGALALASTTTMATLAAAGPAAASTHHAPAYYAGQTNGNVVGLEVNLPVKLASLPNPLGVELIHIDGRAVHDPNHLAHGAAAISTSTASLVSGNLVSSLQKTLGVNLQRTARVSLAGATHQETSLIDIPAKPIADLSVGRLAASLVKQTEATTSSANGVAASVGTGNDLLGVKTVKSVTDLLNSVDATGKVQDTVNQILGQLGAVTGSNPTVAQAVATVKATVTAVLTRVNTLVNNLGTTPLVQVSVHDTLQRVAPSADGVKSESRLGLVGVNVLGGLLTIDGFHSDAMAFANGKAGGARTVTSAERPIVKVNAANALCAQLDTDGISLCKADGLGLPKDVTKQVDGLLGTLSGQLTQITKTILGTVPLVREVPGSSHTARNGQSATAVAPSYSIAVGKLVNLTLGSGVSATAAALQKAPAKTVVVNNPENTPHSLPYTGMNLGEVGLIGIALLGVAAIVRRRVLS